MSDGLSQQASQPPLAGGGGAQVPAVNKTTTDASGNLHSMTNVFTIDLTTFSTWSQAFTATVTGTGS